MRSVLLVSALFFPILLFPLGMAEQRYTIHEQLGAGGNGAVFRAYDTQLKRWVAIKRLLTANETSSTDPNMEELRREADMLASLRNANIVTIFDVGNDDEGLFMVMELLEGPDLADTIARGPLMMEDFKQLAEQTLEALLAAHNLRILHRDIKPENIKVERLPGGRFQAKIIDFGLARTGLAARKQTEDQEGSVMGSIHYMAPEQLSREPTDVRTDLYALGCVFYEAVSGRKAFDGKTVNEVIDKHIDHDLLPLHQLCPHLPQWLTYWVMRLMACKPDDRPSGAQQAIEEFRAWEKLPPAPGMMPWMPMNYGYGYGAPGAYNTGPVPVYQSPTGHVPVQTGAYYPHVTSSSVPVVTQSQVPVATPVVEQPVPVAVPVAPAPQRPMGPQTRPAQPVKAGGAPAKPTSTAAPDKKKFIYIGAGALALILIAVFALSGGEKKDTGKAAPPPSSVQIGEAREDLFPQERPFPQPDAARVFHVMAAVARHGYLSNGSPSPNIDGGNTVSILEDVSKVGANTPLISVGYSPDSSPERITWNTSDKAIKDNRGALDFKSKAGKPMVMRSLNSDQNAAKFPFGGEIAPGQPGLTLAVVFQADDKQLPARVMKLASIDGQTEVTLGITESRSIEVKVKQPSGEAKITSGGVDATKPSIAILTWDGNKGEMRLRTRDQRGMTHSATASASSPTAPLASIEVGSSDPDRARQFSGKLAEVILISTPQKDDQATLLDKDLRDYYFNTPKPGVLNPSKNKALADFPVGEERDIFNGRDLTGWEGASKFWSVKEEALTVKGDPNGASNGNCHLVWKEGTVGDFELTLKFRSKGGTNTGIFYRAYITGRNGDGPGVNGYQFDLDAGQRQRLGGLYEGGVRNDLGKSGQTVKVKDHADVKKANLEAQDNVFPEGLTEAKGMKFDQWNDLRIVAQGNKVQHYINGKQVLELTDEGHGRMQEGIIGFEWQTKNGNTGQFKDIRVKRLK